MTPLEALQAANTLLTLLGNAGVNISKLIELRNKRAREGKEVTIEDLKALSRDIHAQIDEELDKLEP